MRFKYNNSFAIAPGDKRMKKFVIDEKSVNGLFNFLVQYPFKDVYQVIDLLKSLKELPPENDEALED